MKPEIILIFVFWFFDMLFTYINVKKYRKLFPEKDYKKMEMNGIVTFFWNRFGLEEGTFVASLYTFALLLIVVFALPIFYPPILYIMLGAYAVVFTIHYQSFFDLKEEENKRR